MSLNAGVLCITRPFKGHHLGDQFGTSTGQAVAWAASRLRSVRATAASVTTHTSNSSSIRSSAVCPDRWPASHPAMTMVLRSGPPAQAFAYAVGGCRRCQQEAWPVDAAITADPPPQRWKCILGKVLRHSARNAGSLEPRREDLLRSPRRHIHHSGNLGQTAGVVQRGSALVITGHQLFLEIPPAQSWDSEASNSMAESFNQNNTAIVAAPAHRHRTSGRQMLQE